ANENISELLMIRKEEGVDNKELEAMVMADKIKKLKEKLKVYDPDIKGERGLNYRDIVILLRSSTGILSYKKVLEDNMIPVHVVNDEGYFEAREVALILDYLKIIDNPYQDIPFTAVLSSYFCGLNEDEIALLRNLKREENMYDSLKAILNNTLFIKNDTGKTEINNADLDDFISKITEEDGIKIKKIFDSAVIKTNAFLSRLQAIRDKVGYSPVYDLIREILDKGYYRHCSSLVNGERKCANLDMLLKKAEDYAKTSYKGLFQFIRYIDKLKKYEVDYGEANLVDEKDDNVRIMTIHKSKGLEFPVCIIPNINKRYNEKDLSGEILIDPDMGIGLDNIKADKRIRKKTLIKEVIKEKKKRELRAEEMRILYVAMTRAREKVIMTALCDDPQKELDKLRSLADANSYFSLFMYARQEGNIKSISFNDTSIKDITRERVKKEILRDEAARRLKSILNDFEGSKEGEKRRAEDIFDKEELPYYKLFKSNLDYVYEREDSESSYEKHTVTELKEKHLDREEQEGIEELLLQPDLNNEEEGASLVPRFMQDSIEIPANIHGSAVHRIFEIWDYGHKRGEKDVRDFIEDSVDRGLITLEMAASVRVREIYDFVNSDLAERMRRADMEGKLHREQPFVIELDEKLIQGIIDAYFIEDDKIVVVDYKTDRVKESTILRKRYEIQLDYYARALKKMLSKPVKERIIYSTVLKESVLL
ncbi:MAG: PD-(D/E)XK nuclease family protein, partial [Lachnospiraceae bacterium]|nr:PD-(D/E)XK nuclease family protein [Lachnospiraceae bacterium]